MIKNFFVLLIMISAVIPALAQETPESQAWFERYAKAPYIALVNEYETTVKPDWSYEETYHSRIKIQVEAGKEMEQWPIYYNKSRDTLTDVSARVENPDGRQYPALEIKDVPVYEDSPMYGDLRMKLVTMPKVEVGSIIDVTVKSVTIHKEIPNHFWAEILYPAIPTHHAKHTFIFPDDKPVKFQAYKMNYKPLVEKSEGRTKYSIVFEQTDPVADDEELLPPLQEVLGALYFSSMDGWKPVADWYRDLISKNTVDDVNITLKALELTKAKESQKDKARAIIEFIQDDFRYVPLNFGDNMVEPHATSEVFQNRYGDSKDLALLARQMFKIAGMDANIALLSEEFSGNPQAGLPSLNVFSHVILQTMLDGQSYFVDPQLKGFGPGKYPASYDQAHVLIVDESSFKFDQLPALPQEDRSLISTADVTLNPDGSADFRVHVKFPCETSEAFKQTWGSSNDEEKEKFYENLERSFAKNGKIVERKITGTQDRYALVEFDLRYQSTDAYPLINDMMIVKEENQSNFPNFAKDHRRYSIFMPNNSLIKNINTYHVPEGFKLDFVPPSYSMSIDFMDVAVEYLNKDNAVTVISSYHTKRGQMLPESYGQVKDFQKELFKKGDQYIILKKSSGISGQAQNWVKNQ